MELQFIDSTIITTDATNPTAVHMPDNSIWGFRVEDGRLEGSQIEHGPGDIDYSAFELADFAIVTADKNMSLVRLKNVPRMGIYGVWHQDPVLDEETQEEITPERHRFAIWDAINDVSNYLQELRFEFNKGEIVSQALLNLKNPNQILSGENNSRLVPGMKIELFFTTGDSEEYPCGVFYIDRVDMNAENSDLTVEGRNISGKILKDQTWDEGNFYPIDVYAYNLISMLQYAGIEEYDVQVPSEPLTAWEAGIEFEPDQTMMEGIREYISMSLNWEIVEDLDGKIIAGSNVSYEPIYGRYSKYSFQRDSEVFSRKVVRDDSDVYAKVCYYSEHVNTIIEQEEEIEVRHVERVYSEVINEKPWDYASNKTLYVEAPENTPVVELEELANNLASRIAKAGIQETFVGQFRPHLIPGDEAEIIDQEGTNLIGIITTIGHVCGRNGYFTYFIVDSGGVKNKPTIKELINKTAHQPRIARRIY